MSRWVRRAAERRVRIASRRRARRSPRAAGGLGTCSFRRSGRLRGCSAFRHPHQGTSVALLPGTRLAHSSDPSGLSSYGLTKSLGEGDILVASEVVTFCFFLDSTVILICTFLFERLYFDQHFDQNSHLNFMPRLYFDQNSPLGTLGRSRRCHHLACGRFGSGWWCPLRLASCAAMPALARLAKSAAGLCGGTAFDSF